MSATLLIVSIDVADRGCDRVTAHEYEIIWCYCHYSILLRQRDFTANGQIRSIDT